MEEQSAAQAQPTPEAMETKPSKPKRKLSRGAKLGCGGVLLVLSVLFLLVGSLVAGGLIRSFYSSRDTPYVTHRYTWGYYFVVALGSPEVGRFPLLAPASHRHFYQYPNTMNTGGSCEGVYYLSRASRAELIKAADAFMRGQGLTPETATPEETVEGGCHVSRFFYHAPPDPNAEEDAMIYSYCFELQDAPGGLLRVDYHCSSSLGA